MYSLQAGGQFNVCETKVISAEPISVIVSYSGKLIKFSLLASLLLVSGCSAKTKQLTLPAATSDVIHVRDYGAIPNDQMDDARAIQEAVNDVLRTGRSALIKFEPGVYDLEKGIIIHKLIHITQRLNEKNCHFISVLLPWGTIAGYALL